MPPEIYTAALRYKADLAAREAVAVRSMAANYLNVIRGLEDEIAAVARTMALRHAQGLPVTAGYVYRTERYQELLQQAYGQFIRYEEFAADLIARNTATFARLGRQYGLGLLDALEPGISGSFNRLSVRAIENIAGFVDRGPLRALLADAWPQAIDQTTSALVRGVALGYGPRKIAREMVKGMNTGLSRALVLARTEPMRAYRTSKMDVWRETGIVRGFQRVSTHDRRVCPACLFSEGQFIPVQDDFAEHPQGRCSLIPVTRNSGLHQWQYGPEWFEKQSTPTQVSILGPGRHAAWKAGKFGLRDVPAVQQNATWGPSMRARGLAELVGQREAA